MSLFVRNAVIGSCALLGCNCSLVRVDDSPTGREALVTPALQTDGSPAVDVLRVRRGPLNQWLGGYRRVRTLALEPGSYVLEVECMRPGATSTVDSGIDFHVTLESRGKYVVDCDPAGSDNRFRVVRTNPPGSAPTTN